MVRAPVCRVLAAAALVLPAVVAMPPATHAAIRATPGTHVAATRPTATGPTASAPRAVVQLSGVSPAVVAPGEKVVISGTVRNDGTTPLVRPTVRVVAGTLPNTREAVRDWAVQAGPAQGDVVGTTRLAGSIAPGTAAGFRISVDGIASRRSDATYGAVPLSVESADTAVRTFAGYQRIKQYQPLAISWAVPLTLDPDPDLFSGSGTARETAWNSALDSSSRVTRVLDATQDAPVTWALDPSLTPGLLPAPVDAGATGTQELRLRTATEVRITQEAQRHSPWVLADTDADLGAVASQPGTTDCSPISSAARRTWRKGSAVAPTSPGRPMAPTPRARVRTAPAVPGAPARRPGARRAARSLPASPA